MSKPDCQLADVLHLGLKRYLGLYGPMPKHHYDVVNALMRCHTAHMGGHVYHCDACGSERITYNSCRNRHCPSCQAMARARWVDERTRELLPVPYFHVVFTLPAQLNPFALRNKEAFYKILFAAASQTINQLSRNPKHLGAESGSIMVLHTWGQNLMDHPHLHLILPAGGLDDDRWVACKNPEYLFPVKVISALFRGKFLHMFKKAILDKQILLHGTLAPFANNPALFKTLIRTLYRTPWVVYAKPPFGGAAAVVKYLGRYTHRIAIANSRILWVNKTHVCFQWKDYRDGDRSKNMTLTLEEFIRRFLMHVLPRGFVRIRYYGFLANCARADKLQLCRDQIDPDRACLQEEALDCGTGKESEGSGNPKKRICPLCHKGALTLIMDIPAAPRPKANCGRLVRSHTRDPGGGTAKAA